PSLGPPAGPPIDPAAAGTAARRGGEAARRPSNRERPMMLRVLLLEDSRNDELLLAARLRADGLPCELHRVETRAAFAAALEDPGPDLVLSDYNVPGFGGEEALVLTRERRPDLPFLFVSGALGEHAAVELLKRGATDYVLK